MKETVKKIVKKKVSPIPESVKGLKLEHFKLQGRSEFQVGRKIWFQFHYDNLTGKKVGYGSMGMAIHKWTGSEWKLHAYKSSYGGPRATVRIKGGPGGGLYHDDGWKADEPGEFALTPYVSFDKQALNKIVDLKQPALVDDVSHMAMPVYVTVERDKPGSITENPPAPLFTEKIVEVEIEEVIEVEDEPEQGASVAPGQPETGTAPGQTATGTTTKPPLSTIPAGSVEQNEVTRQVIEWHSGSGVGAIRIELSRRVGGQWHVHTVLNQSLDDDNRVEVVFLDAG